MKVFNDDIIFISIEYLYQCFSLFILFCHHLLTDVSDKLMFFGRLSPIEYSVDYKLYSSYTNTNMNIRFINICVTILIQFSFF